MTPKTLLITGCSTGIGYATAIYLRERGYTVIASARNSKAVERLREEGFTAVTLDLADSNSIQQGFHQALEMAGGHLDALFNNAAFGLPGAVEDLSREALRHQFETNVFGTQELTNLAIALMRKQGHGRIIYNSSVLGLVAMTYRGAYNASKYALEGLADTLRLELHNTGIQIVLIEPGPIESQFRHNAFKLYQKFVVPHASHRSAHLSAYDAMVTRLKQEGPAAPFTLPAEAVAHKVWLALTAKRARPRYFVTFPTYLFAFLKRVLPATWLDVLLRQV
ncbi:MAG: SDR family NAD(P)-dependent oxidoreductase [Methylococcales bacterium]|nr:SDR family NAD(P)-dependent oxidoreductase [Methylococcales bacterium]